MSNRDRVKRQDSRRRNDGGQPPDTKSRATRIREAEEILAAIRILWRSLLRNPYADAEAYGMTGPQVTVMACLVARGPITLTELSRTLGMSHSSASGIIDRLEARGLVKRTADTADKRRTAISVTDAVSRYVSELQEGPAGRLANVLENATPEQRLMIRQGLTSLRDLLGIGLTR